MAAAKDKKTVMDVSKPGKSPADATTRPIITGHEMIKDPMVTEDKAPMEGVTEDEPKTEAETTEKAVAPSVGKKVIQPISIQEQKEDKPEEPAKEDTSEDDKAEPSEEKTEEKDENKEESAVSDDAVVDAVLDQVGDKKEETKESEEERKRQELVDKLVEEKKYFVPVGQVQKRRNSRLALLLLGALLPVIVGLGLAADAGVIDPGFKVPIDFIKDKNTSTTQSSTTAPSTTTSSTPSTPTTKKFTGKTFNFSFSYPSTWTVKDESTKSTELELLKVTIDTTMAKYVLFSVTGKGGGCEPAKTDKAYSKTNSCPTYEETAYTKGTDGYLVKTKFMDPTTQKTTEHLCFRPKTDIDGKAITVSEDDLNKPVMGFYLECGPNDLWVGTFQNGEQSVFGVFDQPDVTELQTALKTISIDYTK